jgi:hypothetical protein
VRPLLTAVPDLEVIDVYEESDRHLTSVLLAESTDEKATVSLECHFIRFSHEGLPAVEALFQFVMADLEGEDNVIVSQNREVVRGWLPAECHRLAVPLAAACYKRLVAVAKPRRIYRRTCYSHLPPEALEKNHHMRRAQLQSPTINASFVKTPEVGLHHPNAVVRTSCTMTRLSQGKALHRDILPEI